MTSATLMLVALLWSGAADARISHWQALYGNQLLFEVYRKGEAVGLYRQTFTGTDDNWLTRIEMDLRVPVLFWDYRYRYTAEERWQGDVLQSLTVTIDRNGKVQQQQLTAAELAGVTETSQALLPTHHYDIRAVRASQLFNTLSWQPNQVSIEAQEEEQLDTVQQSLNARRYRYHGELKDVDAWYDAEGRWVGLRFLDERGAPMELRCILCGRGAYL